MKVKLKCARAGHIVGERLPYSAERKTAIAAGKEIEQPQYQTLGSFANEPGDMIDVPEAEARRMILGGLAVEVGGK